MTLISPAIALLPPSDGSQTWDVGPQEATLCAAEATALVDILRQHTASPDRCWFCLWDGYGWETTVPPDAPQDPIPRQVRDEPRAELPGREYFLYTGELDAALAFVEHTLRAEIRHQLAWAVIDLLR